MYYIIESSKTSNSHPFPQFDFHSPKQWPHMQIFHYFLNSENVYLKDISALPITNSLSFDHTFKVASNIGYLREDKKVD